MSETSRSAADMSPRAVERRLREVSDLLDLCLRLRKARFVGYARDLECERGHPEPDSTSPESTAVDEVPQTPPQPSRSPR